MNKNTAVVVLVRRDGYIEEATEDELSSTIYNVQRMISVCLDMDEWNEYMKMNDGQKRNWMRERVIDILNS